MTYRARMENGNVVFEGGIKPVEGAELRIEEVPAADPEATQPPPPTEPPKETLGQRLMKLSGLVKGLPTDAAKNHDHYLYGTPKR